MLPWVRFFLLITLLTGCTTVTEQKNNADFDNIRAAEARITLGLGYLENGNWQRARENLELALQYAPNHYRSLITMAYYLQQVEENEQAETLYKKALREAPRNGDVLNNYGVFLCKHGRYDEAQGAFQRAIEQPYYYLVSASYENAAYCELKSGQRDKAKEKFAKAVDHEPNRVRSSLQLAKMEIEDGELEQARFRLFNFHKRYGYRPFGLLLLVKLESSAGRDDEVGRYGELLASKFPESKEYRLYLENEY